MRVSRSLKQSLTLITCLAICVAAGMWMQHRYASKSLINTLTQRSWGELERASQHWKSDDLRTPGDATAQPVGDGSLQQSEGSGFIVASAGWRVARSGTGSAGVAPATDSVVAWAIEPGRPSAVPHGPVSLVQNGLVRGVLTIGEEKCIAVCRALPGSSDFLTLYRTQSSIRDEADRLSSASVGIGITCWGWTMAMLSIAVAVVLGWLRGRDEMNHTRTISQALTQAQSLERAQSAVILGLAKLAESRDKDTGDHLDRICAYSSILASELHTQPEYADIVTSSYVRLIEISSALHDIGKVGVEDRVLLKPGRLSSDERRNMQKHAEIGGRCLRDIERRLGSSNFLQMAREIAFAHHERWDGNGYPHGLKGSVIPLAARIVAIADVYDAMSSRRVYKPAYPHERCVEYIRFEAGKHFDPDLVEIFLRVEHKFHAIALRSVETIAEAQPPIGPGPAIGPRVDQSDAELETGVVTQVDA